MDLTMPDGFDRIVSIQGDSEASMRGLTMLLTDRSPAMSESDAFAGAALFEASIGKIGTDGLVNVIADPAEKELRVHPVDAMYFAGDELNPRNVAKVAFAIAVVATNRAQGEDNGNL